MTCNQCQPDLSAYVDGELPASRRGELESHLAACPACRQREREWRRMAAAVRALPRPAMPPEFLRDVRAKLGRPASRRAWWPAPLGAVAAVALLVTVSLWLRPPATRPSREASDLVESPAAPAESVDATGPALARPAMSARSVESAVPVLAGDRRADHLTAKVAEQAGALGGRVVRRDEAGGVVVELPAANEAEFRRHLGTAGWDVGSALTTGFDRVELRLHLAPPETEPVSEPVDR